MEFVRRKSFTAEAQRRRGHRGAQSLALVFFFLES
jgi:hypothetical protein